MAGDAIQMVLHRGAQITTGTAFYQAVSAHTSSEANKPGVGTVWAAIENWDVGQMIARLDYRAWANLMYQAAFDHTAAVANRPDMSSISLGFAPVWDRIPDWLTSVSYLLNEYVQYTDDKTYRAIAAHLSTTENDPLEPDVAAVPGVPAFTSPWAAQALWAAGENYVIGDAIAYNAALYEAITAHLSSLLNNPSVPDRAPVAGYTSPWDEAVDVIGVWQPGQSIVVDDQRLYAGFVYQADTAHTSATVNRPDMADRAEIPATLAIVVPWDTYLSRVNAWREDRHYNVGTVAKYNDVIYQVDTAHDSTQANRPDQPDTPFVMGSPGNPGFWTAIASPVWTDGHEYLDQDYVSYQSALYRTEPQRACRSRRRARRRRRGGRGLLSPASLAHGMPTPWPPGAATVIYERGVLVMDTAIYLGTAAEHQPSAQHGWAARLDSTDDTGLEHMADLEKGIPTRWPA